MALIGYTAKKNEAEQMLAKTVALAVGLAVAAGLSQFPEYSQQYIQRLSGAVDELERVAVQFDADAATVGMSRDEALVSLSRGGKMGEARAMSMGYAFERLSRLQADLTELRAAGPWERAVMATRFTDRDIALKAWEDFKPALPITATGIGFAGVGFAGGALVILLLARLLRRRRAHPSAA